MGIISQWKDANSWLTYAVGVRGILCSVHIVAAKNWICSPMECTVERYDHGSPCMWTPNRSWNPFDRNKLKRRQLITIGQTMYVIAIALVKLSLLLQYLRIFVPIRDSSVIVLVTYFVIWSHLIFYLINLFFGIFACSPRRKLWDRFIDGHCFNIDAIIISSAAMNCISDFVILLLPQGVIWRLQMPLRRKLGISAIFLTGFV